MVYIAIMCSFWNKSVLHPKALHSQTLLWYLWDAVFSGIISEMSNTFVNIFSLIGNQSSGKEIASLQIELQIEQSKLPTSAWKPKI